MLWEVGRLAAARTSADAHPVALLQDDILRLEAQLRSGTD